jgi:Ammonium Transporter Family
MVLLSSSSLAGICVCKMQRAMGVDGGENAVSVHLVGGVWGIISPGLLAASPGYGKTFAGTMAPYRLFLLRICVVGTLICHTMQVGFDSLTLPVSLCARTLFLSHLISYPSDSYDIEDTGYRSENCKGVFYGECHAVQCTLDYCSAVYCSVVQCIVVYCIVLYCGQSSAK